MSEWKNSLAFPQTASFKKKQEVFNPFVVLNYSKAMNTFKYDVNGREIMSKWESDTEEDVVFHFVYDDMGNVVKEIITVGRKEILNRTFYYEYY